MLETQTKTGLSRFSWPLAFVAAWAFAGAAVAGEGKILAVYGDAVKKVPPPGWSFLWNAKGEIGKAENYAPLGYDEKARGYGVLDETGKMSLDKPRWGAVRTSKGGPARFYIASFTMPNDSDGVVWLNNGNLQYRIGAGEGGVLLLRVYLNDELKAAHPVKKDHVPLLFQENLGKLKKGDVLYVAVGAGEKTDWGLFALQFTLEERAAGNRPDAPINIVSPLITASQPQLAADASPAKWYLDSQKRQNDAAIKDKSELVFLGDSITASWNGKVLKEKLSKYKPVNMGNSGDLIQNARWRVENGVLGQVSPKVVVVMIGTNNLGTGYTVEEVVEGTRILINTLREKTPKSKILLLGIFPRGESAKDPIRGLIRQANAKTALLADNKTVFFMDIGDKLVEPDGAISKEVMPDGLHPGEAGYVRWADAIIPMLDKLFAGKD